MPSSKAWPSGPMPWGPRQGYVYCRAEYPLAIEHLKTAIAQAEGYGLLGEKIFGSDFSFNLKIREGAGAFVCGEETALIASIEGRVGEPRPRPPFPAQSGLWGKPTTINNVKTWSHIAPIIARGADWYASLGSGNSKGHHGLFPGGQGQQLRPGGSAPGDHPAGDDLRPGRRHHRRPGHSRRCRPAAPRAGCIPEEFLDTPVDYDSLAALGSIMGSGGMIVMDERDCMVNVAKYFLDFTRDESCGKCTPCREGTLRLKEMLEAITEGRGQEGDIDKLIKMSELIKKTSLCGLGATAPNPVLTTIKYFRDEYEAHIRDHKCPAKVCKPLITFSVVEDLCTGCQLCRLRCPVEAVVGAKKETAQHHSGKVHQVRHLFRRL